MTDEPSKMREGDEPGSDGGALNDGYEPPMTIPASFLSGPGDSESESSSKSPSQSEQKPPTAGLASNDTSVSFPVANSDAPLSHNAEDEAAGRLAIDAQHRSMADTGEEKTRARKLLDIEDEDDDSAPQTLDELNGKDAGDASEEAAAGTATMNDQASSDGHPSVHEASGVSEPMAALQGVVGPQGSVTELQALAEDTERYGRGVREKRKRLWPKILGLFCAALSLCSLYLSISEIQRVSSCGERLQEWLVTNKLPLPKGMSASEGLIRSRWKLKPKNFYEAKSEYNFLLDVGGEALVQYIVSIERETSQVRIEFAFDLKTRQAISIPKSLR